ncbi:hypothetical protein X801_06382 [Opisthorchis viverrini]|uniref:Uncharacterized protein n=1 Tax=Opisthorchis viverrini TaxID=6198 RepID=A0A1S8WTC3_OPIVI|nr:hypothetical protein X801_06382 [Opisthorchis viverrini]
MTEAAEIKRSLNDMEQAPMNRDIYEPAGTNAESPHCCRQSDLKTWLKTTGNSGIITVTSLTEHEMELVNSRRFIRDQLDNLIVDREVRSASESPSPVSKKVVLTTEPGYCLENRFSIRLENVFPCTPFRPPWLLTSKSLLPHSPLSSRREENSTSTVPPEAQGISPVCTVVLLGTVTTIIVHEKVDRRYAIIYLGTRESYKVQNGYAAKYSSHRVHVFDDNLFLTVRNMTKGDRMCVHGSLASFQTNGASGNPPMWMSCIVARTICPYSNPAEDEEVIVSDDPSVYNKLETALDEEPSWSSSSSSTPIHLH